MKNRQILCVLLVLCTLLTGTQASAQDTKATVEGQCGVNVSWKYNSDGVLFILGNGKMDDYPDKEGQPWYEFKDQVKIIVIGVGISYIGKSAFEGCSNAEAAVICDSVVSIGDRAFAGTGIKAITLPESAVKLGKNIFEDCTNLVSVKLPGTLTEIPWGMFLGCTNLEKIDLPSTVQAIDYDAFHNCKKLTEITFPATLRRLESCLGNCYEIRDIYFLGPYPQDWNGNIFSQGERTVHCKAEYYEEYKKNMLSYSQNASRVYSNYTVHLTSGPQKLTLDKYSVEVSHNNPTAKVTPITSDMPDNPSINWTSLDPSVAAVDQNGEVSLLEKHGGTLICAEIALNDGCKSITTCLVQAQHNDQLVKKLPTSNVEADYPVTCNMSGISKSGLTTCYKPAKLAESDISNEYYQEILQITNRITSGCGNNTEKARAIHTWVNKNISYGGLIGIGTSVDVIYATYVDRAAHCQGFSYLTGFMLMQAGIPNGIVTDRGHMWNIVLLDGRWVMLDSSNGAFDFDYNDPRYGAINYISLGQGDCCMMVTGYNGFFLAGVGNHELKRGGLTDITVPSVETIFDSAFKNCEDLKSVSIPISVKTICQNAFCQCALTDVYYEGTRAQWNSIDIDTEGNDKLLTANIHCADDDGINIEFAEDQPSDWALDNVMRAASRDLLPEVFTTGFSENTTRAEFCAITVRLYETLKREPVQGRTPFKDTTDVNVQKMAYLGVVNGVGDGNFNPNGHLTREQAATILVRLAAELGSPVPLTYFPSFSDNDSISSWAFIAVARVNSSGIMIGVDKENFAPLRSYTREQSIVTLMRLYDFFASQN